MRSQCAAVGSGCTSCIFQRANQYQLLFSPSKLFIHTDKQGEERDVRSRERRRGVSDMRAAFISFLFFPSSVSTILSGPFVQCQVQTQVRGSKTGREKFQSLKPTNAKQFKTLILSLISFTVSGNKLLTCRN